VGRNNFTSGRSKYLSKLYDPILSAGRKRMIASPIKARRNKPSTLFDND
jgi:hypothetical protein